MTDDLERAVERLEADMTANHAMTLGGAVVRTADLRLILAANRKMREQIEALEQESADLTKALTGLTCGGSEFFIRKGERYVADIPACVGWVRRGREASHQMVIEAKRAARSALSTKEQPDV